MKLPAFQEIHKKNPRRISPAGAFGCKQSSNYVLKLELHAERMSKQVDVFSIDTRIGGTTFCEEVTGPHV